MYCRACGHHHQPPPGPCHARTTTPTGGAAKCTCTPQTPQKDRTT